MNNKLSTPYTLYWLGGRKLEHRSGFTLIELMLSVVLFVLGTVAVVQVIALGISVDKSTEGQATALNLAQEALEAC
ncbi:MAG: prepilin-type N-terminal cleavage/methylation domain-containing protein, partial [Candidatus Omnitrophota bacterium]